MIGRAALYVRQGVYFLTVDSQTEAGFWIEEESRCLDTDPTHEILAEEVLQALEKSRLAIVTPPRDQIGSKLPELAGVKSFSTFMKGAICVDIKRDENDTIKVTPMTNKGRDGFKFLTDLAEEIHSPSDLATALEAVLESAD